LSKYIEVKSIIKEASKKMGAINCLVNCASVFENDDIKKFNNQKWQAHFDINLKAPAILCSEFTKQKIIIIPILLILLIREFLN
jgi:Dehydrogenases with different specificities (related to short-chain alcohol dehydrogenases)